MGINIKQPVEFRRDEQGVYIRNLALHPQKPMRKLPRSRWERAWLALRGWELYGN